MCKYEKTLYTVVCTLYARIVRTHAICKIVHTHELVCVYLRSTHSVQIGENDYMTCADRSDVPHRAHGRHHRARAQCVDGVAVAAAPSPTVSANATKERIYFQQFSLRHTLRLTHTLKHNINIHDATHTHTRTTHTHNARAGFLRACARGLSVFLARAELPWAASARTNPIRRRACASLCYYYYYVYYHRHDERYMRICWQRRNDFAHTHTANTKSECVRCTV